MAFLFLLCKLPKLYCVHEYLFAAAVYLYRLSPYLIHLIIGQIAEYVLCCSFRMYVYGQKTPVACLIPQELPLIGRADKDTLPFSDFRVMTVSGSVSVLGLCGKVLDGFHFVPFQRRQLRYLDDPETL